MKPKDKLTLRFELTNLQARFALLAEMHKEAMTVLPEMRRVLQEQRAEITILTEENARLKEALTLVPPSFDDLENCSNGEYLERGQPPSKRDLDVPERCGAVGVSDGAQCTLHAGHEGGCDHVWPEDERT